MSQYMFGSGNMFIVPSGANPTVTKLGTLQETAINFSGSQKELIGQYQFPEMVARSGQKVTGSAKFARISVAAYNSIFFGASGGDFATGQTKFADNELKSIPDASGPYTISVDNAATHTLDLGVIAVATGLPMQRVASSPATGQYSVAAGVYTFAAADKLLQVYISYLYTSASTGKTITIRNQLMGAAPTFKGVFAGVFGGKYVTLVLNACISTKLKAIETKAEDFTVPDFEFSAFVDSSNVLGTLSADE